MKTPTARLNRHLVVAGHHGNDAAFAGYPRALDRGFQRWLDMRYPRQSASREACITSYFQSFDAAIEHLKALA
jgi:hypothetical protein